jgi:glycosyltransferase involved in cell wall biosynthesis
MKTVDIITRDMHQLHGANKVTEKLIIGRKYFEDNGFCLRYVISQDGIIECAKYKHSTLGIHLCTHKYQGKRRVIETLKQLPIYRMLLVQKCIINKEISANDKVYKYFKTIETKPDIIIFQDPYTAIHFFRNTNERIKSIFISHADKDPLEHVLLGRPSIKETKVETELRREFKKLFNYVDEVVTICKSSKKYMKKEYGLDCPCIINGIEEIWYKDTHKYSEEDKKIHIAIVASIQYRKGQDLALKALSNLPKNQREKIVLHIFGGGEGLEKLKKLRERITLSDDVRIYGPVLEIERYLPKMDVFMLPSRADTVPIAIIEAMRAGLPIFASHVGEIPNMVHGCGDFIEATTESIFELYMRLINNEYDLVELGIKARSKFLEEFQLSAMIGKYSDVLKGLE